MRIEIPELKRCCFCVPLRRGLLFWGYLKLAVAVLLLVFFVDSLIRMIIRDSYYMFQFVVVAVAVIVVSMEIAFCILFLVSGHKKNHEQMKIYYRYAVGILILEIVGMVAFAGIDAYVVINSMPYSLFFLHYMLESICIIFTEILLQAYFVILVRSEIRKFEKETKFEFVNHTSEPECKAQIDIS